MKPVSLILFLLLPMMSWTQSDPPKENKEKEPPSIQLFSESKGAGKGLLVEIVAPVDVPAAGKTVFSYRITNLLEEEVFVELPDECAMLVYDGPDGSAIGGGVGSIFPDNLKLLKRLHASSYKTGERFTCGCATVTRTATVDLPVTATAKGKATITLILSGFYRSTGKDFHNTIELPLPIKAK